MLAKFSCKIFQAQGFEIAPAKWSCPCSSPSQANTQILCTLEQFRACQRDIKITNATVIEIFAGAKTFTSYRTSLKDGFGISITGQ
ncbi:hypothetical protein KWI_0122165 [Xanthomonas vasicola pv. vasculorum NCPPB 206]|nr:hypothetical protein KWI_0122165 [Xanthomonas vasicola pv. vasculorum NCPPB 206]